MDDRLNRIAAFRAAVEPFNEAFRPIFRSAEGSGRRRIEGSATLVEDGALRFAITAHHVVLGPTASYIGVCEAPAIPWPKRYSRLEPLSELCPDPDIAWARASVAPGEKALDGALPAALAIAALDDAPNGLYVAAGFPASRGKVRMGTRMAAAKLMFAAVDLVSADRCRELGLQLDPRVHIAFTYAQEGRVDEAGESAVGAHPQGMSGGAVMLLGNAGEANGHPTLIPFLVAVLTQFHERIGVLVATRVWHLWHSIGYQPARSTPLYRRADA